MRLFVVKVSFVSACPPGNFEWHYKGFHFNSSLEKTQHLYNAPPASYLWKDGQNTRHYRSQVKTMNYCNISSDNKLTRGEHNDNNEAGENRNEVADTDITAAAEADQRGVEPVVPRHTWGGS